MTPYAILLVKPTDSDDDIRKTYQVFARATHADLNLHKREEWERYTSAYTLVKTEEARMKWGKRQSTMAGLCGDCDGCGVRGTRRFKGKIQVCSACKGEGRIGSTASKTASGAYGV
jgi:DnaJ-class molecular chaperone